MVDDPQELTFMLGELYALRRADLQRLSDQDAEIARLQSELSALRSELAASPYTVYRDSDNE